MTAHVEPRSVDLIVPSDAQPLSWEIAAHRLVEAGTFWLATVRADGRPHLRPVLAVWTDGALHVASSISARKWPYLTDSGHCAIATGIQGVDLVIEGKAVRVTDEAGLRRIADAYASTYGWPVEIRDGAFWAEGAPTAGSPPFHVFAIRPETAYGFGTDDDHAARSTRWRFQPPERS